MNRHILKKFVKKFSYIFNFFCFILKYLIFLSLIDKKLDNMTMRKYEKIKENVLMMQQYNTKRFEREKEITPGPDHYNPSYSLIENDGFAVRRNQKI